MIKTRQFTLEGRDAGRLIQLTELPALRADRLARQIIRQFNGNLDGGVVALALRYQNELRSLGQAGADALMGFVQTDLDLHTLRDWKNVAKLQQVALLLHVDFLFDRELIETPVSMKADAILAGTSDTAVTFCSPFIETVLESRLATYSELETTLSTEDAFNLCELLNVAAIRDYKMSKRGQK